jgi:predicted DNA binding protein
MRELKFALEFDRGVDPIMDVFHDFPQLGSDSVGSAVRRDRFWSVERFEGPTEALERVERVRFGTDTPRAEMTATTCGADRHHEILERSASSLVTYSFVERLHTCNSVVALAARHLDLGHVFQTQRRGECQEWRLLMRSEANVDVFYESVEEHLRDGITLHIGRIGDVNRWNFDSLASVSLSGKERDTLRAAIEHGYYETPREVTVSELADRLDVPQSTVSYRLRQAEAALAKGYFRESAQDDPRAPEERVGEDAPERSDA